MKFYGEKIIEFIFLIFQNILGYNSKNESKKRTITITNKLRIWRLKEAVIKGLLFLILFIFLHYYFQFFPNYMAQQMLIIGWYLFLTLSVFLTLISIISIIDYFYLLEHGIYVNAEVIKVFEICLPKLDVAGRDEVVVMFELDNQIIYKKYDIDFWEDSVRFQENDEFKMILLPNRIEKYKLWSNLNLFEQELYLNSSNSSNEYIPDPPKMLSESIIFISYVLTILLFSFFINEIYIYIDMKNNHKVVNAIITSTENIDGDLTLKYKYKINDTIYESQSSEDKDYKTHSIGDTIDINYYTKDYTRTSIHE